MVMVMRMRMGMTVVVIVNRRKWETLLTILQHPCNRLHARGERVQQQAGEAVAAWQRRLGEAQELESEYRLLQEKHRDLIERSSNPRDHHIITPRLSPSCHHHPSSLTFLSLPYLPPIRLADERMYLQGPREWRGAGNGRGSAG
jgi:hypothetical protein